MEYPEKLHDLHNDYPLAPERVMIDRVEKLIPNPNAKSRYVIHHRNLKQYLSFGMQLKSIRRGIRFTEKPLLKSYIMKNTELRKRAKNSFKLMKNSVFGKTMENIRNRVDVRLVNNRKAAEKLSAKPNFKHLTIFDENLVAINERSWSSTNRSIVK